MAEKEYIERGELLSDIGETVIFSARCDEKLPTAEMRGANKVIDRIKSATAADLVEVVRCKDCKHFITDTFKRTMCNRTFTMFEMQQNDFCSYGAKMDGKGESE